MQNLLSLISAVHVKRVSNESSYPLSMQKKAENGHSHTSGDTTRRFETLMEEQRDAIAGKDAQQKPILNHLSSHKEEKKKSHRKELVDKKEGKALQHDHGIHTAPWFVNVSTADPKQALNHSSTVLSAHIGSNAAADLLMQSTGASDRHSVQWANHSKRVSGIKNAPIDRGQVASKGKGSFRISLHHVGKGVQGIDASKAAISASQLLNQRVVSASVNVEVTRGKGDLSRVHSSLRSVSSQRQAPIAMANQHLLNGQVIAGTKAQGAAQTLAQTRKTSHLGFLRVAGDDTKNLTLQMGVKRLHVHLKRGTSLKQGSIAFRIAVAPSKNRDILGAASQGVTQGWTVEQPTSSTANGSAGQPSFIVSSQQVAAEASQWIVKQIAQRAVLGQSTVEMTLVPAHLGKLQLRVSSFKNGELRVQFTASTTEAQSLIRDQLPALLEQLQMQGFQSVAVDVRADSGQQQQQSRQDPMTASQLTERQNHQVMIAQLRGRVDLIPQHEGFSAKA
ncbi:MAG: flagellar hook-length control protein FliK [Acidibacillus sp.]|nr:flagellar hook-length control protein FliK [Acidibacillus sp.]